MSLETAVVSAPETENLSYNFANPRSWQAFVKRMVALEQTVALLQAEVASLKHSAQATDTFPFSDSASASVALKR